MKQYAIFYKSTMTPLCFYCTLEACMQRLLFLTDAREFGVYEVQTRIIKVLKDKTETVTSCIASVCSLNNSVLQVYPSIDLAFKKNDAIKSGLIEICDVEYQYFKEIKRPKNKEDSQNDFLSSVSN